MTTQTKRLKLASTTVLRLTNKIHTEKPKEETYVRVSPRSVTTPAVEFAGQVGKVLSEGSLGVGRTMVFVEIPGFDDPKVFNGSDVVRITKKEYFKGALRGKG